MRIIFYIYNNLCRIFLAIGILLAISMFYFFVNNYSREKYSVSINEKRLNFYLSEEYTKSILPYILFTKNWKHEWIIENEDEEFNYRTNVKKILIDINSYSCYNKYNEKIISCDNFFTSANEPLEKETKIKNMNLKIMHKGDNIYNGVIVNDVSEYVTEPGRYYFVVSFTKKNNFYSKTEVKLLFNIYYEGDNNE